MEPKDSNHQTALSEQELQTLVKQQLPYQPPPARAFRFGIWLQLFIGWFLTIITLISLLHLLITGKATSQGIPFLLAGIVGSCLFLMRRKWLTRGILFPQRLKRTPPNIGTLVTGIILLMITILAYYRLHS